MIVCLVVWTQVLHDSKIQGHAWPSMRYATCREMRNTMFNHGKEWYTSKKEWCKIFEGGGGMVIVAHQLIRKA